MMSIHIRSLIACTLLASTVLSPAGAQTERSEIPAASAQTVLASLKSRYQQFTLPNGLKVVVYTDHSAPTVAVSLWYKVGSGQEPAGKTGFAHLFEHLMFQGSENFKGEYFAPFNEVGGTDMNGTTSFDRTNYYETVPTPALDMALWMESDRMGHLVGAIDQATLDEQRAVVKNEKRQRSNAPGSVASEKALIGIFPVGHPYDHMPIGSMADLDAASVADVRNWFTSWYGPNNAVLVLAGDIDLATARKKAERYFGDIKPSASMPPLKPDVPRLAKSERFVIPDVVPRTTIQRTWPTAPAGTEDAAILERLPFLLTQSTESPFTAELVRKRKIATSINSAYLPLMASGPFFLYATLTDGQDVAEAERAMDEQLRVFLEKGPDPRTLAAYQAGVVKSVAGGSETALYQGNAAGNCVVAGRSPDCWLQDLRVFATATPEKFRDVARRWLSGNSLTVVSVRSDKPAEPLPELVRPAPIAGAGPVPRIDPKLRALPSQVDRSTGVPKVTTFPDLRLPPIERASLSNGVSVVLMRRTGTAKVSLKLEMPQGGEIASRRAGVLGGVPATAMSLISSGAGPYDRAAIERRAFELGAAPIGDVTPEGASIESNMFKADLAASLDLFADALFRPRFDETEVELARTRNLATLRSLPNSASRAVGLVKGPLVYGPDSPYGAVVTEPEAKALTRDSLVNYQRSQLVPNGARFTVVGDISLTKLVPLLEARFGAQAWKPSQAPVAVAITPTPLPQRPRIFLLDNPGASQAIITAVQLIPPTSDSRDELFQIADFALGGTQGVGSRLNMNLREGKGWSYGIGTRVDQAPDAQQAWRVSTSVQKDRTADSMREILGEVERLADGKTPVTEAELKTNRARLYQWPAAFSTPEGMRRLLDDIVRFHRPDDYLTKSSALWRTATPAETTAVFGDYIKPSAITWIVAGPLKDIEAPIRALNWGDVEVIDVRKIVKTAP